MSTFLEFQSAAECLTSRALGNGVTLIETRRPGAANSASVYLIEGDDRCLVVDTGFPADSFLQFVRQHTEKPLLLFLTHGHPDHSGNVGAFDTVYMSAADRHMIPDFRGQIVDVSHGFVFELGQRALRVVELSGHTAGSLGLLDERNRMLFCGDAIGSGELWMHVSQIPLEAVLSITNFLMSIRELCGTIYVGHIRSANGPLQFDYVLRMHELVEKIVRGGDVKAEPYPPLFPVDCEPFVVRENGIAVIYNPKRIHYL